MFGFGREKVALGPLAAGLAAMVGGHVGTNALGVQAHHHSNVNEQLAHQGFQHGLLGSQITPSRLQAMKSMLGPESTIAYEAALIAGQEMVERHPNPLAREAAIRTTLLGRSRMDGAPVMGDLAKAMTHEVDGTSPVAHAQGRAAKFYSWAANRMAKNVSHGMETPAQKLYKGVAGVVPAAGLMAADTVLTHGHAPLGAALHFGWNGVRQVAGNTPMGKKIIGDEVAAGLAGKKVSPRMETLYNYGVSPAYLDARRGGQHIRDHAGAHPEMLNAANQLMANRDKINITKDQIKGLFNTVQHTPGAIPQAGQALDQSHIQTALKAITPQVQKAMPQGVPLNLNHVGGAGNVLKQHGSRLLKPGDIGAHNFNDLLSSLHPAAQKAMTPPKPGVFSRMGGALKRTLRL